MTKVHWLRQLSQAGAEPGKREGQSDWVLAALETGREVRHGRKRGL